jgi:ketosteroid isomerase-like protein
MLKHARFVALVIALLLAGAAPPAAASDAASADIKAALVQWMDDFNGGHADEVCDLFARNLRSDFRGQPERGYDALCGLLRSSLADRARAYSYALAIKEILVWGDTAVVRLTWTLTVRPRAGGSAATSVEPGLDVFRLQPDGHWRIVRYLGYAQ